MSNMQLLLLKDVEYLGRSGDVVSVKAGYARNFLIPSKKAMFANKQALNMKQKLQAQRQAQAIHDQTEAQKTADCINESTLTISVKIDSEGHLYGSVTSLDILELLKAQQIEIEKKSILLSHPIKTVGTHTIQFKLKENIMAQCQLDIVPENGTL